DGMRTRGARHRDGIGCMIGVAVREQHQIERSNAPRVVGTGRVAAQPRIDQELLASRRAKQERGVAKPRKRESLHGPWPPCRPAPARGLGAEAGKLNLNARSNYFRVVPTNESTGPSR